jgi:SAM-dependent MidA family methyltransferase
LSELLQIIIAEIKKRGAISFEEFMRLALYCPIYGFYEKEEDTIGRNGDFYTSVSVGNLFGELLAFQFDQWLAQCQSETRPVQIVEAGAHRGHLARDILIWLRDRRPELFQTLQYVIIEPSATRQKWQSATLAGFGDKVTWLSRIKDHASRVHGVIFANELLDAIPVRRFGWNAQNKDWFEWGVTLNRGELAWTRLDPGRRREEHQSTEADRHGADILWEDPLSPSDGERARMKGSVNWQANPPTVVEPPPAFPPFETNEALLSLLPNNFSFEICPGAQAWWQNAAHALEQGRLMTIDYGLTTNELILPERKEGTLRGYYRHHPTSDLLANPGEQDLTAHLNFSALIAAGEANGLKTEKFETQAHFVTQLASQLWKSEAGQQWNAARARQFQTLTHPDHLGRNFRVLVQLRNSPSSELSS